MGSKKFRNLVFLLVLCLILTSNLPNISKAENFDGLEFDNNNEETVLVPDDSEEDSSLQISEINENFDGEDLSVAPLKVDTKATVPELRTRSMRAAKFYPAKFDLRQSGMVSPVKDQGQNGSCWAFATYGSMESILLRQKKGLYDFSEKHLRNMHGFDWSAEKGGNRDMATAYFASGKGPISEDDDPYDPVITVSKSDLRRILDIDKVIYLPDVTNINEIDNIKWAINEYGGVYTTVNSTSYYENKSTNSMYNPGHGSTNHAVTIVGWDDTFPATAFTQNAPGNGAWICKNSWGNKYMDSGFYYVSYYDGFIGKSPTVFVPRKKDLRGIIHQYDPLGATRSVGFKGEGYMANIYTAKYKELLHEVGVFNVSNQTSYEVYVVRHIDKTSQLSDDRVKVAEGNILYPGYYTIDITPQQLDEGEQFAVVVYMNSQRAKNNTPLAIESRISGYTSKAAAAPGQSFYSKTGSGWKDLTETIANANFCIKAITTTGDEVPEKDLDEVDDSGSDIIIDGKVKLRDISFNQGSQGVIEIDKKGILRYTLEPANADDVELVFGSMDKKVAVFKDGGILYPVAPGNTNVFIKTKDGTLEKRFNVQVVNPGIRIPGREKIEVLGVNDYVPEPEPEPEKPGVPDDKKPDPIKPELDPDVAISLFMNRQSDVITEGKTFNIEPLVGTYPATAKRNFIYYSDHPNVVEARPDGILVARGVGYSNITVMTDKGLKTTFRAKVVPDYDKQVIEITSFTNSERRAGIFRLYGEATVDGKPYNGAATIIVKSDDKVVERKVYFNAGKVVSKYLGGDFALSRSRFEATLKVRNEEKTIRFGKYGEILTEDLEDIRIISLENTERHSGIFRVNAYVEANGKPYTGYTTLEVEALDGKTITSKLWAKEGYIVREFTAASFGSGHDDFVARLTVGSERKELHFSYDLTKPAYGANPVVKILYFRNSATRTSARFTLTAEAMVDGKPFDGYATITTEGNGRKLTNIVKFTDGKAQIEYTAGRFANWRKEFTSTLNIYGEETSIKYSYN